MRIQTMLITDDYRPSHIKETHINEHGKHRIITSSPFFPDQIIHWALMNVLSPIFLKSMYHYCIATIPGRGISLGMRVLQNWLRNDVKNTKYCLKTDIHHFYPSIDHDVLKNQLLHRFKDKRILKLLFDIIDCYQQGLPLGLYTSQWLANFSLEQVDHRIKEKYHAVYYIRYMDDMVILGPNKKKLHRMQQSVSSDLSKLGLQMKSNWYVAPVDKRFIDFLGFKFHRNYTELRRRDFLNIKRKAKRIYKKGYMTYHDACSMLSYYGIIKHSDSHNFYEKYVAPYTPKELCKKVISNENDYRTCTA